MYAYFPTIWKIWNDSENFFSLKGRLDDLAKVLLGKVGDVSIGIIMSLEWSSKSSCNSLGGLISNLFYFQGSL